MSFLLALALICFFIGIVVFFASSAKKEADKTQETPNYGLLAGLMSLFDSAPTNSQADPARFNNPPPAPARFRAVAAQMSDPGAAPRLQKLASINPGNRIRVRHPQQGELTLHVDGRILFQELWQTSRSAQAPWVPTGNTFAGFWLETNLFLLNWQNRFYLLEEAVALSDADIQTQFMPFARQFAQSDQKADIWFAYPPTSWHIDDIGKFRVSSVEGSGFRLQTGAIARFIHAKSSDGRGLVVEDHQGEAPGQDTAWIGWMIQEEDIQN